MSKSQIKSFLLAAASASVLAAAALAETPAAQQSFQVKALEIDTLVAQLTIEIDPAASGITTSISGKSEYVQLVRFEKEGDTLNISMDVPESDNWWDWFWGENSFSFEPGDLVLAIRLAPGTPVNVDGLIGDAVIGDLNGPLKFSAHTGETRIGAVTQADIEIAGSGDIRIGAVGGALNIDIAGSGDVQAESAASAEFDIAGGGDIRIGAVANGLDIDMAGSGNVTAASVNGEVDISIAGSGDVRIESGKADPFDVDIMGAGDVHFGGTAHNPDISVMGSGDVFIASYTGNLSTDGGNVKIGSAQ